MKGSLRKKEEANELYTLNTDRNIVSTLIINPRTGMSSVDRRWFCCGTTRRVYLLVAEASQSAEVLLGNYKTDRTGMPSL
jgi:hypothetical protein